MARRQLIRTVHPARLQEVGSVQPVVTPLEMAELDRSTIEAGTPEAVLVERAGAAVARAARRLLGGAYGRRVVVACGRGNNGADGRVAAERLRSWGVGVTELDVVAGIDREAAARALARADLLVDAMFGTGFRGRLDGDAAWVAGWCGLVPAVLAVDIPSGVAGSTGAVAGAAVVADATVTFAAPKPGLVLEPGRTHAGRVVVADIGIPVPAPGALVTLDADDVAARLPVRGARDHKWTAALLVVGGSRGMTGAPVLAGTAALRAGAGMVVCALAGPDAAARASGSEIVTRALPATAAGELAADAAAVVLDEADRYSAVVVGPGIGRSADVHAVVARLVADLPTPVVVDADALHVLGDDRRPFDARRAAGRPEVVLTPHAGEFRALTGHAVGADRLAAARELAAATGAVAVLKGPGTVVAAPDPPAAVNPTGGPELATAGTGDVLAGVIGAFLAAGLEAWEAATVGAWVHGATGDRLGEGLLAGDLAAELPRTLSMLRAGPGRT